MQPCDWGLCSELPSALKNTGTRVSGEALHFASMSRLRVRRFTTVVLMMVSLLFMQLAVAQHACQLAGSDEDMPVAMEMAPGQPCHDMDADLGARPALCHHHCENAAQSFEPVKLPSLTLPAIVQVLLVPLSIDGTAQQVGVHVSRDEARPPPSPVFLSTLRLRV